VTGGAVQFAGLHLSTNGLLRLVVLSRASETCRLVSTSEYSTALSATSLPANIADLTQKLAGDVRSALSAFERPMAVAFALDDNWFQLRRVPLEIASADARQNQIQWEAAQALLPPDSDFHVRCLASDRSGIWMAVRRQIVDGLERLAGDSDCIAAPPVPLPLALVRACEMNRESLCNGSPRLALVHVCESRAWLLSLAVSNDPAVSLELRSIETVPASVHGVSETDPVEGALRWISGDRTLSDRYPGGERVVLTGEGPSLDRLVNRLPAAIPPFRLNPFSGIEDTHSPTTPEAYPPAAGAAWSLLNGDAS